MLFTVYCKDKPNALDIRKANRAAHLDYAGTFAAQMIMGGPLLADDQETMIGSFLLMDMPTKAAVEDFCQNDPYAKAGLFESVEIHAYKKVLPMA
jgi:uncharacterized protein YciI